jgi:hypothetical protein
VTHLESLKRIRKPLEIRFRISGKYFLGDFADQRGSRRPELALKKPFAFFEGLGSHFSLRGRR